MRLHLGPRALAVTGVALCCAWLVVTLALGRVFRVRQQAHAKAGGRPRGGGPSAAAAAAEDPDGDPPVTVVAASALRSGSFTRSGALP